MKRTRVSLPERRGLWQMQNQQGAEGRREAE